MSLRTRVFLCVLSLLACSDDDADPTPTPRGGAGGARAGAGAGGDASAADGGEGGAGRGDEGDEDGGRGGAGGHGGDGGTPAAGGGGSGGAGGVGGTAAGSGGRGGAGGAGGRSAGMRWQAKPGASWQYQLSMSENLDLNVEAEVFDIDLVGTSQADIDALHDKQRKVVCYFDTAYEPDRAESKRLEPYRGNPMEGWPGQYWLDIRAQVVVDVMLERIALAATKHCDGVEADDVDSRSNDPGFEISAAQQQGFIKTLAEAAHTHGLAFGLKNDLDEVSALLPHVDFAVNEQCFEYSECNKLLPFISADKAVFNVEYVEEDSDELAPKGESVCPRAKEFGFSTVIKHFELGPDLYACPE